MKCYDKAARSAMHQGFREKVIFFLQRSTELGKDAKMTAFEKLGHPKEKLIQWELQIANCMAAMGDVVNQTEHRNKAKELALSIGIDMASVPPFFAVKTNNRRRGMLVDQGRNTLALTEHLTSAMVEMEKREKKTCSIM